MQPQDGDGALIGRFDVEDWLPEAPVPPADHHRRAATPWHPPPETGHTAVDSGRRVHGGRRTVFRGGPVLEHPEDLHTVH
ncbi:hypothetical protein ACFWH4_34740, partial [Streptomyces sp. NPDC127091]|uniref:hypothetical protein n=1 Tax=Streptomyces sp. NPDC127091 TaxID=3347134 RepID=UPI00364BF0A2